MNQMRTGSGGPPIPPPSIRDIQQAAGRISGVALRTPLLRYRTTKLAEPVWLKAECLQPAGSFKLRGVLNWARSLSDAELARGLSTQSAGNTAQALGYVARLLGVPARSLLPDSAPRVKVDGVRSYGVTPVPVPFSALMDYVFDRGWEREPYSYLNPWGDPSMLAGSGTIGMEILDELPELAAVYIPVGGGGLVAAIGSVIKELRPAVEVVGVQSTACPSLGAALEAGRPTWVQAGETICDGTSVPVVVDEMFPLVTSVVDRVVPVSEDDVRTAIARLALGNKLVVEGSGAMSLAAALGDGRDGPVACIVSGGSIGADRLAEILTSRAG
ncbi:MAG: threonine/serine dehydratase [bacterium]|nr:threonine/serine dehydratase [bacterium]MDE0288138.1 threonine/serine dehydratase [bacterium]MDE0438419.1 threonine/serine dehydratase [bacterium]